MAQHQKRDVTVKSQFTISRSQKKFIKDVEYNLNDKNPDLKINQSQIVQSAIDLLQHVLETSGLPHISSADELTQHVVGKLSKQAKMSGAGRKL